MIVKFFRGKHHTVFDGLNYLMGGTKRRKVAPTLLRGNLALTREYLKRARKFKKAYTYGCLSFAEANIPDAEKIKLMDQFERLLMAGLTPEQYDFIWVEHRDKERLELNFHVVNMELTSGKSLTPYFHRRDMKRIDLWKQIVNDQHGYHNPDAPQNVRTFSFGNNSASRQKIMTDIDQYVMQLATDSVVNNQQQITHELNKIKGLEVVRQSSTSISIKVEGLKKNIRLKNGIYGKDFRGIAALTATQDQRVRAFAKTRQQRIDQNIIEVNRSFKQFAAQRRAQYPVISAKTTTTQLDLPYVTDPIYPRYRYKHWLGDLPMRLRAKTTPNPSRLPTPKLTLRRHYKPTIRPQYQTKNVTHDQHSQPTTHHSLLWRDQFITTIKKAIEELIQSTRLFRAAVELFKQQNRSLRAAIEGSQQTQRVLSQTTRALIQANEQRTATISAISQRYQEIKSPLKSNDPITPYVNPTIRPQLKPRR